MRRPRCDFDCLVFVLLSLLAGFWVRHVFTGSVLFERDVHLLWTQGILAFRGALAEGRWPFWNPTIGFGQPLWADPSSQALYPFTWITLVVPPWRYYSLGAWAHLAFSGYGMFLLIRSQRLSQAAALVAAMTWVSSGPLLSVMNMPSQFFGSCWLPWVLLAGIRAFSAPSRLRTMALAATLSLQFFTGYPESVAMSLVGMIALTLCLVGNRSSTVSRGTAAVALALVLAFGLTAISWLPLLGVSHGSARWTLSNEERSYWSLSVPELAGAVLPSSGHSADPGVNASKIQRDPLLHSTYLGAAAGVAVAMALTACAPLPGRTAWATLLLFCAWIALGQNGQLFDWTATVFPPLRTLRFPAKSFVFAGLAWSALVGLGVESWRNGTRRRLWMSAALVITSLGALYVGRSLPPVGMGTRAAIGVAAAMALWLLTMTRVQPTSLFIAASLVVLDLAAAHYDLVPHAPPSLYSYRPPVVSDLRSRNASRLYAYDYLAPGKSEQHLGRVHPYSLARAPVNWSIPAAHALGLRLGLLPPTAAIWGFRGSYDLDVTALWPRSLARMNQALRAVEGTPLYERLLRLGAVSDVTSLHAEDSEALTLEGEYETLFKERLHVYRVRDTLPRTYVVGRARRVPLARAVDAVLGEDFDPAREVLLSTPLASESWSTESIQMGDATAERVGEAVVVREENDHIVLRVDARIPAYVVLVDAYSAGWHGHVDGREKMLWIANGAFRSVAVEAGSHRIDFVYFPPRLKVALVLSSLALAACIMFARAKE